MSTIKEILKEVISEIKENTNKASLEKNSEIKGDMVLLYKLFANQKGDNYDWPQIHLTGRYKDDNIHVELLGEEVVFVFTKEGQFKGVYNYKE